MGLHTNFQKLYYVLPENLEYNRKMNGGLGPLHLLERKQDREQKVAQLWKCVSLWAVAGYGILAV